MNRRYYYVFLKLCLVLCLFIQISLGSQLRKQREVTVMKFIKLVFFRLIYGFANMFGLGEVVENIGDGVLAPPDSDYRQEDNDDDDDDYDYENDYDSYDL